MHTVRVCCGGGGEASRMTDISATRKLSGTDDPGLQITSIARTFAKQNIHTEFFFFKLPNLKTKNTVMQRD